MSKVILDCGLRFSVHSIMRRCQKSGTSPGAWGWTRGGNQLGALSNSVDLKDTFATLNLRYTCEGESVSYDIRLGQRWNCSRNLLPENTNRFKIKLYW